MWSWKCWSPSKQMVLWMLARACLQPLGTASTGGAAGELSTTSRNRASSNVARFDTGFSLTPCFDFCWKPIQILLSAFCSDTQQRELSHQEIKIPPLLITEQRDITWSVLCPKALITQYWSSPVVRSPLPAQTPPEYTADEQEHICSASDCISGILSFSRDIF